MLVKVGIWGPKPVQAGGGRWEPGGGHCEHRPSADPGVPDEIKVLNQHRLTLGAAGAGQIYL